MAENIGKVVVSIEARVEELEKGMAKAEATVRRSAAKIEANQKSLSKKIGKSWTELASKLNVITTVARIAEKAWNVLDGVLLVVTDSTKNASNKILGSMEVMEKSSIPVVSQFMKIGHGIHDWISGEKKLRREIERTNAALEQRGKRMVDAANKRSAARQELEAFISASTKAVESENAALKETTQAGKLRLQQAEEIAGAEEQFREKAIKSRHNATDEWKKRQIDAFNAMMEKLRESHDLEMSLAEEVDAQAAKAEADRLKAIEERKQAKIKAAEDEAKHLAKIAQQVQNQTDDLQTRLTQLSLEDLGLDLESKLTGIHAKFDRLRQNANSEQITLLNQIEAIENKRAKAVHSETTARENDRKSAIVKGKTEPDEAEKGQVASIQTALGSFTVGIQHEAVTAKQTVKHTSLLKAIASASPNIATAAMKTATAATKQVTLLEKVNNWLSKITGQDTAAIAKVDESTLPNKAMNDMLKIFKAKEVEPVIETEVAVADNEVRIIDMVNVTIPENQIALLTKIADETHDKAQVQVLEKIATSSAKVAKILGTATSSGIIIAS